MGGFLYIVSNPSMPGLVKVGKTTTSPSQRMAELHTTGVPTPFELEFCAEIEDCHVAETLAHVRLARFRLADNREFFRVGPKLAIEHVLPSLGNWRLHYAKEAHGIEEIARRQERQELAERECREREARVREQERERRAAPLLASWREKKAKLAALGPKPHQPAPAWVFLTFCYLPIPVGWIVYAGALQVFSARYETTGLVCISLIIGGYIVNEIEKKRDVAYRAETRRWTDLENELWRLREPLKNERIDPDTIPLQTPAPSSRHADYVELPPIRDAWP